MSHFYDKDGNPQHTFLTKDGKESPSTIREARKNQWYSSVTTIFKELNNEGLNGWRIREGIKTALFASKRAEEDLKAFIARIEWDSGASSREAMEWGTAFHKHAELFHENPGYKPSLDCPFAETIIPAFDHYVDWYMESGVTCIWSEKVRVCPQVGVAGTVDYTGIQKDGTLILRDFKGQGIKDGNDPDFYDYGRQLAMYAFMTRLLENLDEDPEIESVVINRNNPERPHVKRYSRAEQRQYLREGLALVRFYHIAKKYCPPCCDLGDASIWLQ